jgi:hypothetical protein
MIRDPVNIPPERGVYALVNKKRRFAYVAFTQNLQKRSHSMSHMLMGYDADRAVYWPIKDLPKHSFDEFTFIVLARGCAPERALAAIAVAQRGFANKNYSLVAGHRAGMPVVSLGGRKLSLAEAVRERRRADRSIKYGTVYRRLQRGWSAKQALGLDNPDPRWDHDLQMARRERSKAA